MNEFTVRNVGPGDREEWLRMRGALWPEDGGAHSAEIDAFLAGRPMEFQIGPVFVAERATRGLCGFAEASLRPFADACDEAPAAYLEGIWVDEDLRRAGAASALVKAVEAWARGEGRSELGSDFHPDNAPSRAFHAAAGFGEVERLVIVRKRL